MSQSQRITTQQLLQQSKVIHRTIKISSYELQNKLNFISKQIENHSSFLSCSLCNSDKSKIDNGFKRAFKKLNLTQKVIYYHRICTYIKKYSQPNKNLNDSILIKGQKQMLDTTVYIKDKHQYQEWTVTRITISLKTKKINITDKSIILNMHDYLIRTLKNKDKQKCFAIESIINNQRFKSIKFSNQSTSYDELYKFFKKVHKQTIKDQLKYVFTLNRNTLTSQQDVDLRLTKLSSNQQTPNTKSPLIPTPDRSYRSSSPILQRTMTIKLVSVSYGNTPIKVIQKQMLQRQSIIRIKDRQYNQIYKRLLADNLINRLQEYQNYQKIRQNGYYSLYYNKKQQILRKKYKFKCSEIIFDWLVDQLNNYSNFYKWKSNMQSIKCLKALPSQKTKIFHQVYKHQQIKYNYLYIRHHFNQPNLNSTKSYNKKIYYFYDKSIILPLAKNYFKINQPVAEIQYIIWKFAEINDNIELTIQTKCNHSLKDNNLNIKFTQNFLGQFEKIIHSLSTHNNNNDNLQDSQIHLNTILFENQYIDQIQQIQDIDNETEYFSINDQLNHDNQKKTLKINQSRKQLKSTNDTIIKSKSIKSINFLDIIDQHTKGNHLKFKHSQLPYKKDKPIYKQPKTGTHPIWETQWNITSKGQLINVNKQKIQAQNSVLKGVFKNFGRNFLSGKSILSISLPVEVFGDDSNLSRLCYSYGYAPIMLEAAVQSKNAIQRFRNVFGFAVSATVCYLRMDKPFNPILGQTCQILIDGCPVYGQQISHHPPISAVFMKGRDYTVYGHLQSKVELGLNSASGINGGQICVSFDKDDISKKRIRYTGPPGELSGVIYGDRKMCMIKTSYFVDEENYLFCELTWSKHKGKSQYAKNFYDSVQGIIYKLKSKVNIKIIKSIKKDDIESQIGMLNGRWTGAIFYNNDLILDTFKTFPHVITEYSARLQSDVQNRKDLLLRRTEPDLVKAQQAKQQLEELQRKDRKLRAQYNKDSKH